MHTKQFLVALAAISAVAAQDYYNAVLGDPVRFWSDYGDYLAKMMGDTVSVITAGQVPHLLLFWPTIFFWPTAIADRSAQDATHTTYHLNCAGPSASMDAFGCIVGNGATVVRGQNIINMRTVLNGQ